MRQDERAPFHRALARARVSAYRSGEFVEQESFMGAGEILTLGRRAGIGPGVFVLDLCCGVAGPGRLITQELGCTYLGVDYSPSAINIARERTRGLPCRFEVAQIPPVPRGPFDVVLLLETMLAFADKEPLIAQISGALTPGGRFAFTLEEGPPLSEAERALMPDADTVWLTPLEEMRGLLEQAGLVVRSQEECGESHAAVADALIDAFTADAADIGPEIGGQALDELLAAHRLWRDWLRDGRVRKFAIVAEKTPDATDDAKNPPPEARKLPTGRIARTARVGGLVTGQGARWAGMRTANRVRSPERAAAAQNERTAALVNQLVNQLGQMRGAAMKVGQVLSMVEFDGLPEDERDALQAKLAELRDDVPPVPFVKLERLLRDEFGGPLTRVFSEFDERAFAAASIGQVHRATTRDGNEVVVKVQYPGVAEAVETDLRNAMLLLPLVKRLAPSLDVRGLASELRERIAEELDYELEAQNQRRIERLRRGHPFGLLYRDRIALGDPHPGNYLLRPNGGVGFLDYGLLRDASAARLSAERGVAHAVRAGDAAALKSALVAGEYVRHDAVDLVDDELVLKLMRRATRWFAVPGQRRFSGEQGRRGRERRPVDEERQAQAKDQLRRLTLPAETVLIRRMHAIVGIVLGQLRAGADWGAIAAEYLYGEPPATPLGEAEAEYFVADAAAGRVR